MLHRFIGPRYETSTNLCYFQEYLFQSAVLSKMFIVLMIANSLFQAIKYGILSTWQNDVFYLYCAVFVFVCIILSVSFQTAELFCPFNNDQYLYYKNWANETHIPKSLIAVFCCFFMPLCIALIGVCFFTTQSVYISRHRNNHMLNNILFRLGLYPIFLVICVFPILGFLVYVIVLGRENNPLRHTGLLLVSSSGIFVGVAYYFCLQKAKQNIHKISTIMITSVAENSIAGPSSSSPSTLTPQNVGNSQVGTQSSHRSTVTLQSLRTSLMGSQSSLRNTTVTQKVCNPTQAMSPQDIDLMRQALLSDYDNYHQNDLYLAFSP